MPRATDTRWHLRLQEIHVSYRTGPLVTGTDQYVRSPNDAAAILRPLVENCDREHLIVLALNTKNRVTGAFIAHVGSLNASVVRIADIFKPAILTNAAAIVVCHNHPSGDPTPSAEDIRVTRDIVKAGQIFDMEMLDHIIIGHDGRWRSMKQRGDI